MGDIIADKVITDLTITDTLTTSKGGISSSKDPVLSFTTTGSEASSFHMGIDNTNGSFKITHTALDSSENLDDATPPFMIASDGKVTIDADLIITGTTKTVNSTNTVIKDTIIGLNAGVTAITNATCVTNTTVGNEKVVTIDSTSLLTVGDSVTGTNIPDSTTVASIDSATQFTLSKNATGAGTVTLAFGNAMASDSGIVIERGTDGNDAFMGWDKSTSKFIFSTIATDENAGSTGNLTHTLAGMTLGDLNLSGDLAVTGGDVTLGAAAVAGTVGLIASAHDAVGNALTISGGSTTAGTTNDIAGGNLVLQGGAGKGTGNGGSIIFKSATAGGSANTLNSINDTILTLASDLSSTFAGDVTIATNKDILMQGSGTFTMGTGAVDLGTGTVGCGAITSTGNLKFSGDATDRTILQHDGNEVARIHDGGTDLPTNFALVQTAKGSFGYRRQVFSRTHALNDAVLTLAESGAICQLIGTAGGVTGTITLPDISAVNAGFWIEFVVVTTAIHENDSVKIRTNGHGSSGDGIALQVQNNNAVTSTAFSAGNDILTVGASSPIGTRIKMTCVLGGSEVWIAEVWQGSGTSAAVASS